MSKNTFEKFMLLMPFVFCPVVIFDLATQFFLSHKDSLWVKPIESFIFLGQAHGLLTYVLIISVIPFRRTVQSYAKDHPLQFWSAQLLLFFYGLVYFFQTSYLNQTPALYWMEILVLSPYICLIFQHSLYQIRGLAIVLTKDKEAIDLRVDKKIFAFMTFLMFASIYVSWFWPVLFLKNDIQPNVKNLLYIVSLVAPVYLVFQAVKAKEKKRAVFLARLFVINLSFYSSFALILTTWLHGPEYFWILSQMRIKKEDLLGRKEILTATVYFVFFTLILILSYLDFVNKALEQHLLVKYFFWSLRAVAFSFGIMHIFTDAVLFRFARPAARENILPLINLNG